MDKKYTKLGNLVNDTFTIEKVWGYDWKAWDAQAGKMKSDKQYFDGARKVYGVDTNKGKLDLSEAQLGKLYCLVGRDGQANLNNRMFRVTSNGKAGIDIRYYFAAIEDKQTPRQSNNKTESLEDVLLSRDEEEGIQIPF